MLTSIITHFHPVIPSTGFGIREIWDYLLGGGYSQYPYGHYPGQYPGGSGVYPGQYPGQYGGNYGGQYGGYRPELEGPPGAHPGCPLCDSSVYSYCYHKQAHDSCCCENSACKFC